MLGEQEQRTRIANVLDGDDPSLIAAPSEGALMKLDDAVELALSLASSSLGRQSRLGGRHLDDVAAADREQADHGDG
jgi:hypothetical protein